MKKLLLVTLAVGALFFGYSQTTLFTDDFESGSGNWSFNGSGDNSWIVNNVYYGGGFVTDTPNQPSGQTYYMHIMSGLGCSFLNACNANFDTGSASLQNADLVSPLDASTASTVTLEFWYLCAGAAGTSYGSVHVSNDGGVTWTQMATYSGVSTWTQETLDISSVAAGSSSVLVRFEWQNGGAGNDPAFAVDDVVITAMMGGGSNSITTMNDVSPASWCYGTDQNVTVNFVANGTYTAGNVYTAEISDASGSFASPTAIGALSSTSSGALTINGVVPGTMPAGTGYRIRVIATNPSVTGSDNATDLVINDLPTVTFSAMNQVCVYDNFFALTGGSPAGGAYSGPGVTAGVFDPGTAGIGTHVITYTYTDGNGCANSAQQSIVVDACAALEETTKTTLKLYPNPATESFSLLGDIDYSNVELMDMSGRILKSFNNQESNYSLEGVPTGVYLVRVKYDAGSKTYRLIKK